MPFAADLVSTSSPRKHRIGLLAMLLPAALLVLGVDTGSAQPTQAQRDAIKASCRADFIANCSGVQPGGLPALQCLQKNNSKLSTACQKAIAALKQ